MMGTGARLFSLKHLILKNNATKFRIMRRIKIIDGKNIITFDIQKKKKFLIFEWWSTISTDYKNIRQARLDALDLISQEGKFTIKKN